MSTSVSLTGASGYLGAAILRALTARGDRVLRLGRRDADDVVVDLAVGAVDWRAVADPGKLLVHCAGRMANDASAIVDTVRMATNLLSGLPSGVSRLVLVSSAYVYAPAETAATEDTTPRPSDAYGFAKLSVESLFEGEGRASDRSVTILRPCAIFGPDDPNKKAVTRFVEDGRRGVAPTLVGDVHFPRDYVHIDDVVRAVVAAIDTLPAAPVRIYNVATGRSWSPVGLARLLGELRPALYTSLPAGEDAATGYRFDSHRAERDLRWVARIQMRDAMESLLSRGGVR